MNYPKQAVLALVKQAKEKNQKTAAMFARNDNPQVVALYHAAVAKASVFEAVEMALTGKGIAELTIHAQS